MDGDQHNNNEAPKRRGGRPPGRRKTTTATNMAVATKIKILMPEATRDIMAVLAAMMKTTHSDVVCLALADFYRARTPSA